MIQMGLADLGEMGILHLPVANSHPAETHAAVCGSSGSSLQVVNKFAASRTYTDPDAMPEIGGAVLNRVFSDAVEDEVYCTLYLPDVITICQTWPPVSLRATGPTAAVVAR